MEIAFLGHASLIVRTPDLTLYCDPVFHDPHHEELFEIYPRRSLDPALLPPPTHLFVSHQHFDHFDIRTLAGFRRDIPVIIPDDALIAGALETLGFADVRRIEDWSRLSFGGTNLLFTPSEFKVPEHGILIEHDGAVAWNQVDTEVSPESARRVAELYPTVDLVIAPWQPLIDGAVQYNRATAFPIPRYADHLVRAARVGARMTVPGACGFRFVDGGAWQNSLCFPATRERFAHDLARLARPDGEIVCVDPGDVVTLGSGGGVARRGEAGVTRHEDWNSADLLFDPGLTGEIGRAVLGASPAPDEAGFAAAAADVVARLEAALAENAPMRDLYAAWGVIFQLSIVGGGRCEMLAADLKDAARPRIAPGFDPLATMHSTISLAALAQLREGRKSWDYVVGSGAYRHHRSVFHLSERGIELPPADAMPDPLWLAYPYPETLNRRMAHDLRLAGAPAGPARAA